MGAEAGDEDKDSLEVTLLDYSSSCQRTWFGYTRSAISVALPILVANPRCPAAARRGKSSPFTAVMLTDQVPEENCARCRADPGRRGQHERIQALDAALFPARDPRFPSSGSNPGGVEVGLTCCVWLAYRTYRTPAARQFITLYTSEGLRPQTSARVPASCTFNQHAVLARFAAVVCRPR